ncbi:hypothetical protein CDIK_3379 [Cucumispora dikerogammari]|nr:hypothetical protein CDIK_3379 [Cucumispora dikerogammari]
MLYIVNRLFVLLFSTLSLIIIESLYNKNFQPKFLYLLINCTESKEKLNLHFNLLIVTFFLISLLFKKTSLRNTYLNLILVKVISETMKVINDDVLHYTNIAFLIIIINFIFACLHLKKFQKISTFLVFYAISRVVILKYEKKIQCAFFIKKMFEMIPIKWKVFLMKFFV